MTVLSSPLLNESEAASYLGLKPQTLASWRHFGRYGLKFYKAGRYVRYRQADLDEWLNSRAAEHTGVVPAART